MARAYHGTGEQAIEWVLHVNKDLQHEVFLKAWQEGDAEACWPEFYEWLDGQDQPPKLGDGTPDAALAIGEHAHRDGYEAALLYAKDEGWAYYPDELERAVLAGNAWSAYDPPEHIKELC